MDRRTVNIHGRLAELLEATWAVAKQRPEYMNVRSVHDFARQLLGQELIRTARDLGVIDEED